MDWLGELLRLRTLYRWRGPLDGQVGVTPEGRLAPAERWHTASVLEDANKLMHMDPESRKLWAEAIGLPIAVSSWSDPCPARGGGDLTHARTASDPGVCVHCGLRI